MLRAGAELVGHALCGGVGALPHFAPAADGTAADGKECFAVQQFTRAAQRLQTHAVGVLRQGYVLAQGNVALGAELDVCH